MTTIAPDPQPKPRRRRRILRWLVGLMAIFALLVIYLPFLASLPPARRFVSEKLGALLAPAKLEFASYELSWFGPTRVKGLSVTSKAGAKVLEAEESTWDVGLWQLATRPRDRGMLTLHRPRISITRDAEGHVDLDEALAPLFADPLLPRFVAYIEQGRLTIHDPSLAEPIQAEAARGQFGRVSASGQPGMRMLLTNGTPGSPTMLVDSNWGEGVGTGEDFRLLIESDGWPLALRVGDAVVRTRVSGAGSGGLRKDHWTTRGSMSLRGLKSEQLVDGKTVTQDLGTTEAGWEITADPHLAIAALQVRGPGFELNTEAPKSIDDWPPILARVDLPQFLATYRSVLGLPEDLEVTRGILTGTIELTQDTNRPRAWRTRASLDGMQVERGEEKVSFDTPVSIDASGPWTNVRPEIETLELSSDFGALALKPESAGRLGLSGTVELGPAVSIANSFLEEPLPELAGDLQVRGAYENEKLDLELTGLVIPPSPEANPESTKPAEPLELSSRIQYDVAADRMAFENVAVKSSLAEVTGRGQIEKLVHGPRTFELDASARPDEGRVVNWLRERTDPAAELSGLDAITLKLAGPLEPALREVAVDARASFASARIWGLDVGATTIKLHSKDEMIEVAPIETTVNHGVVVVEPKIVHTADGWVLELGSQTRVDGMEVNEDVSNRLLAYVAPVLAEATRVRGRFSARVIDAVIPLDAPDLAEVTARAAFDDVQFAPGPLAMTVLGMTSLRDATLSLDQPIEFAVSDRKVYTRGLEVPIVGEGIKLTLDGAVGFDRRVALTFSLPFSPALFPRRPALAILVGGNRIDIPITGTLAEPKLDGEGLGKSFADFGLNMLERAPVAGGIGLFRALTRQRESQQQGAPMEAPRDTPGRIVPSPPLPGPAPEDTPMTREERKLERQRKAAERKAARKGIDP